MATSAKWQEATLAPTESTPLQDKEANVAEQEKKPAEADPKDWIGLLAIPIVVVFMALGTFVFFELEGEMLEHSVRNSLYFCTTMLTTVGYGDFSPETPSGRIAAIVFILVGLSLTTTCIGIIFARAAEIAARKDSGPPKLPTVRGEVMKMARAVGLIILVNTLGAAWAHFHDHFSWLDSYYWAFITSTSVGFGDIDTSEATRNFEIAFMVVSVVAVANGFGTLVEVIGVVGKIHRIEKFCSRGVTADLIAEIDDDKSGDVDKFEFFTYMLVNMGKLDSEDVEQVMELFKHYDIDNSGYLTIDDVVQANKLDDESRVDEKPVSAAKQLAWKLGLPVKIT